jgi:hypothetical protein
MKKPDVFLRNYDGSGGLSVYWAKNAGGSAIEAKTGKGVGFFTPRHELLGVEFDDVEFEHDKQELVFSNGWRVTAEVIKGKVKVTALNKKLGHSAA